MSKKEKNLKKPYSPGNFLKDFIVIELVLIYLTLRIGDIIHLSNPEGSMFVTRYIPIAVVALIFTFLVIRSRSKKSKKSDEESIRKNILLGPVIVAIILLFYGLYSVSTNLKEIEDQMDRYSFMYDTEVYQAIVDETLEKAASEARASWIITSVTYLLVAESVAFLSAKKVKEWLKEDDEVTEIIEKTDDIKLEEENKENELNEENTGVMNNIKWEL